VVAITEDDVRQLAALRGVEAPITSCYLDVDGRRLVRRQDVERAFANLARPVLDDPATPRSVRDDLERMQRHVQDGIDRRGTRGLVMLACSAQGLWKVVELPVPVHDQLVVNAGPALSQLEGVLDEYEPFGVLLADRQRARMFVFELGELVECEEDFEQLPRQDDPSGQLNRDQVQDLTAEKAQQHLRHAAAVAFDVWQRRKFDHLAVGAPEEIAGELESLLHPYLRERLGPRIAVTPHASHDEVRTAALELEARMERAREQAAVDRLRDAAQGGGRGAAGLKPTLEALVARRVDTLLVSDGYAAPGWRCGGCEALATVGRTCPVCGGEMDPIDDVIEDAVHQALSQGSRVEICVDNADLDVLGRVGALLRF
jgi:peptide subunit release factor 1 (eRF1)